ncbi:PBP1A family penicillin-binding protein [Radiobacillus kanasensis]|uniref:transglycosylase domain-containing protein n=1 Tax=Radiobacillus kanasensis TaxID=2844358 RepID=UPI001E41F724|nr:PBP1A family penicillin-binding protein [Radiobacillus kanasensis]UFU01272.1 PBP1A family penicillin-binding protein [Radiobacillus kanasensis]
MANNSQSRMERRKQKKNGKKPIWKKVLLIFAIIMLVAGLGVGALFTYYIAAAPDINEELLYDPASTKVYDMNGELFADLGQQTRTKVSYDEIPTVLRDAVIATEDARFFSHFGIDFRRIAAAVWGNVTNGFGSEGASTITQQVVKRSFLSPDKTLKRKVQEQWLAVKLDSDYSKEQILEMYLNKIYYGSGAYGVATAAKTYFGKEDLSELTLPEAALLAGLPQRPSAYDPFKAPDLAKERMETVLSLMVQHNKITEEEAEEAKKVKIEDLLVNSSPDRKDYEAFIQKVAKEVEEKTGANIYNDSMKIYTTLDPNAQDQVEFLLSESEENPIKYPDNEFQAGLTVLDTKTGAIRAIGGGRKLDDTKNGWNYAIDGDGRQAGSTFKPIIDYGPAIEYMQWSTYHQLNDDKPYPIAGTDKVIRNWNDRNQGWMSIRYAIEQSLNVPAVKTYEEVGAENAQKFAESLGITFNNDQIELTDAIGGAQTGVTPMELAGAYRAFGNEGIYNEPYAVTKVEFEDETIDLKPKPTSVMEDSTAYMITDMLKSVVQSGTGTDAAVSGLPIAGKTGTTNIEGKSGSNNSWFSGYTTNYTISVWTGYDENKQIIPEGYTELAEDLFRETMAHISEGIDTPDFKKPSSVVEVAIEKGSNPAKLPSKYTPDSKIVTELFVKGTEPTKTSEKYDQIEPITGLQAKYNKENNTIDVTWKYNKEQQEGISFNVSAGVGDSDLSKLTTTKNTELEISKVEKGKTYTIEVLAVSDENEDMVSEPARITVQIPEEDEEEEEEEEENGNDNEQNEQQIQPVIGLTGVYEKDSVIAQWGYNGRGPVSFEVKLVNAITNEIISATSTDKKEAKFSKPAPGDYVVEVITFNKKDPEQSSEPRRSNQIVVLDGTSEPQE